MFSALLLAAVLVHPGDTLSGIASAHGVSLASVEAANPQITNPNLIYVGDKVNLPGHGSSPVHTASAAPTGGGSYGHPYFCGDGDGDGWDMPCGAQHAASPSGGQSSAPSQSHSSPAASAPSGGSSSLADIPGVPRAFAACIAFRESTNGTNPAAHGNVYGLVPSGGHDGTKMSLAQQKATVAQMYAQYGTAPWSPYDGC